MHVHGIHFLALNMFHNGQTNEVLDLPELLLGSAAP